MRREGNHKNLLTQAAENINKEKKKKKEEHFEVRDQRASSKLITQLKQGFLHLDNARQLPDPKLNPTLL